MDSPAPRRMLYAHGELRRLIHPASIAVVGVSANPASFGRRTLANLAGFQGRLFAVNPKYDKIGEVPCLPSLSALPAPPDCVVIAVPREAVEAVVAECATLGVGGAIVYTSGYAETGLAERTADQQRLAQVAAQSGMRLIGPNCIGIVNNLARAAILFQTGFEQMPRPPARLGLVSQSGALGFALSQAAHHGVGLTHVLAAGNSCDVDVCDLMGYLVDEPECRAIACVFEGIGDAGRLLEVGRKARAADKPVVVCKLATGSGGAAAALSHTGALAGSQAGYAAAFERAGFIVVDDFDDLMETAGFFAKAGRPRARGVAVMATSGGAAVMAVDKAEALGVPMPQPGPAARRVLESRVPEYGSPRNPCDVTAQVLNDPESFRTCADALLEDPAFGALILPQVTAHPDITAKRVPVVAEMAQRHGKPICIVWLSEWLEGPGAETFEAAAGVAMFRSMRRCYRALAAWHRREDERDRSDGETAQRLVPPTAVATIRPLLGEVDGVLSEGPAKQVLAAYGVPVVAEELVQTAEEAVRAAVGIGFPVVLKIDSPDIPHKTEVGVVRLGLANADAVRDAFADITGKARAMRPAPSVHGVLVQPMVTGTVELMVGARRDPQFGPLVVVGLGGTLVEVLRDTAVALAPVGRRQAMVLLERLKGFRLLGGFRGTPPADLGAIAETIVRVSELAADGVDRIADIDVNPLICGPRGACAADALIVLKHRLREIAPCPCGSRTFLSARR